MIKWVRPEKYAEMTGDESKDTFRSRRRSGAWLEGKHWKRQYGVLWLNVEAIQAQIERGEAWK